MHSHTTQQQAVDSKVGGTVAGLRSGNCSILRNREEHPDPGRVLDIPCADAFSVIVQLRDFASHKLWRGNRLSFEGGHRRESMSIAYMGDGLQCQHLAAYDNLRFTLPSSALDELLYEEGAGTSSGLERVTGAADPVAYHLARAMVPALGMPGKTNQLFIDQVMLALSTHLGAHYGSATLAQESGKGLSSWQLRRAQELIASHLADGLSVARLAEECSLSRSYFTRAFKRSTGMSPHEWLLQMRVEKARELMLGSALCLSQIGLECGFADQSHFSRVFLRLTGMTPANWRRFRRGDRQT
ncbi:HTH-type transcriptional activator RhaR [compost metagenome]